MHPNCEQFTLVALTHYTVVKHFLDDEPKYFLRDVTFQTKPLTIMQQFPHVSKLHRQYQKHFFAIIFSTCTELFVFFYTHMHVIKIYI